MFLMWSIKVLEVMKFKVGKYYKHNSGTLMHVIGGLQTSVYGWCLIGEQNDGRLVPVGQDECNAVNWQEITEQEWQAIFSQ